MNRQLKTLYDVYELKEKNFKEKQKKLFNPKDVEKWENPEIT